MKPNQGRKGRSHDWGKVEAHAALAKPDMACQNKREMAADRYLRGVLMGVATTVYVQVQTMAVKLLEAAHAWRPRLDGSQVFLGIASINDRKRWLCIVCSSGLEFERRIKTVGCLYLLIKPRLSRLPTALRQETMDVYPSQRKPFR